MTVHISLSIYAHKNKREKSHKTNVPFPAQSARRFLAPIRRQFAVTLWARITKNTDWSTGPLARPFARGKVNDQMAIDYVGFFFYSGPQYVRHCVYVRASALGKFAARLLIWGGPKKSKSCSRPAREVRFFAWYSACLKKHIYSDIRPCKILTFFVVYFETCK